jgi:hypothetical protein
VRRRQQEEQDECMQTIEKQRDQVRQRILWHPSTSIV